MRILTITGSGISADSGIPTFRGNEGYWRNNDPMKLASPPGFAQNPRLVWQWYAERRNIIKAKNPNPGHQALAHIARKSAAFLLVTQNVDDLHERAGSAPEQVVHIHGDIFVNRCTSCQYRDRRADTPVDPLPVCPRCGSLLRPGVVWFGEELPRDQIQRVEDFLSAGSCDLVLVVGTTASFGYIVDWAIRAAGRSGRLVEVNPEPTPLSSAASQVIRCGAAEALPRLVRELC